MLTHWSHVCLALTHPYSTSFDYIGKKILPSRVAEVYPKASHKTSVSIRVPVSSAVGFVKLFRHTVLCGKPEHTTLYTHRAWKRTSDKDRYTKPGRTMATKYKQYPCKHAKTCHRWVDFCPVLTHNCMCAGMACINIVWCFLLLNSFYFDLFKFIHLFIYLWILILYFPCTWTKDRPILTSLFDPMNQSEISDGWWWWLVADLTLNLYRYRFTFRVIS